MTKLEIIRAYWDAESEKDIPGIMSLFSNEITIKTLTSKIEGYDAIHTFYKDIIDAYKESEIIIHNSVEEGDQIAVEWTGRFVTQAGEVKLPKGCHVFAISGGKILSMNAYFNPADF